MAKAQDVELLDGLTDLIAVFFTQGSTHSSVLLDMVAQMEDSRGNPDLADRIVTYQHESLVWEIHIYIYHCNDICVYIYIYYTVIVYSCISLYIV